MVGFGRVGHALTLLAVAAGVGLLGWVISPELAGRFEQAVGAMLILLGLNLAWRLRSHPAAAPSGHVPARGLFVGMVHGLAGSAALALLVSQTLPSLDVQLAYVALFGLGSLLGMALLSGAIVLSVKLTARRIERLRLLFNAAVALGSVGLGLRLLLAL